MTNQDKCLKNAKVHPSEWKPWVTISALLLQIFKKKKKNSNMQTVLDSINEKFVHMWRKCRNITLKHPGQLWTLLGCWFWNKVFVVFYSVKFIYCFGKQAFSKRTLLSYSRYFHLSSSFFQVTTWSVSQPAVSFCGSTVTVALIFSQVYLNTYTNICVCFLHRALIAHW